MTNCRYQYFKLTNTIEITTHLFNFILFNYYFIQQQQNK